MRPGARLKAAADVLEDILVRHRPAATALADWGKAHRFAGSGDRATIGTLVYDALRRKSSIGAKMGADTARALVLGAAPRALALTADEVAAAADALGVRALLLERGGAGRPCSRAARQRSRPR